MPTVSAIPFVAIPESGCSSAGEASDFPENWFVASPALRADYETRVRAGRLTMARTRVVICGLVRDVGTLVPTLTARLERLTRLFADYRVVLFENDSRDDTREQLTRWAAQRTEVTLLTEDRGDPVNPPARCLARAARMAAYRNQYHNHVAMAHADFDAVIVVDTDLAGGWSCDGIAHTFGSPDWDAVGSNGVIYRRRGLQPNELVQYDAWAFRRAGSDEPLECRTVNDMTFQRGEPLVPVNSCFGGLAVYRMSAFLSAVYAGGDTEHVPFHRQMRDAGYSRMFLNPSQIVVYGRHRRSLDPVVRVSQRIADWLTPKPSSAWKF